MSRASLTENAIDIQGLTKVFGDRTVVDHISLRVKQGSVFGFLGANGSGKTTTIRMICGLLTPTEGEGHCLGYNIRTQSAEIKRRIGYMPQKFALYNGLTVYENLKFFAQMYELTAISSAIDTTMTELELQPYKDIKAGHLSGGWKQRLALACCLVHQPALLFLDEPTAGVDPKARKSFWDYLHSISVRGMTVLVTTHYMDEAEKCTDLAYVSAGKLLYAGATADLVPFSHAETYVLEESDRQQINALVNWSTTHYPDLLVSVVNNTFRISSCHKLRLAQFLEVQKKHTFKPTTPSFEEVFIGLMQPC